MPAIDLDRIKEQGRRFVDGFTPGQKAMTILGVIAVVLAGMAFMKWASAPDWTPLYSGLSSQDAGSVTQQLDAQNVKYKIAGGGGTILVSKNDVYKTRISLSAKGIPAGGGDSFAKFDNSGITTDQFTRNVQYQRALQDELAKTIESIDNVQAASVTLTIPQDTVFVGGTQDKPSAAVLVKTTSEIDDQTVQAVVHLVASSVPNLSPDDVTVADANGKVLHAPGMDTSLAGSTQIEQKQQYEAAISKKITDMIAATLGPGHAAITVNADLDTSTSTSHSTTYTNPPAATKPIKENTKKTTLTEPAASGTSGILGVGNNGATATGGNGTRNFSESDTANDNAVDSSVVDANNPPGTVKRLTVSAVLDNAVVATPADVTKWTNQIQAAAGIEPARDGASALQVTTVAFDQKAAKAAQAQLNAASGSNPLFDLIKHVLTLLMIALVLFFAWKAIKRAEANRVPLRVPLDLRELEAPGPSALELAPMAAAVAAPAARRPIEPPPSTLEGDITDLIERQPDEVAQTLRSWLADRRS